MSTYTLHNRRHENRLSKLSGTALLILIGFMVGCSLAMMFVLDQIGNLGVGQ